MIRNWLKPQEVAGLPDMPIDEKTVRSWGKSGKIKMRKKVCNKGYEIYSVDTGRKLTRKS